MKERNLTLNEFLERQRQMEELKKSKQLIRRYIEEVAFEQVREATVSPQPGRPQKL